MSTHTQKISRRLVEMHINLLWATGAANSAREWAQSGKTAKPQFQVCFREALAGARRAVREGEAIERALAAKGKARP